MKTATWGILIALQARNNRDRASVVLDLEVSAFDPAPPIRLSMLNKVTRHVAQSFGQTPTDWSVTSATVIMCDEEQLA